MYQISYIENEAQLKPVLDMCYEVLGQHYSEYEHYTYEAWSIRIEKHSPVLLYAHIDNKVVAAVLGRPENEDSLVMGFTACDKNHRRQGITRHLVNQFEENARALGFKYITLGAQKDAEAFYEKCGYKVITEMNEQKIFQKVF